MMILVLLGCLVIGSTSGARPRRMVGAAEIPIEQAPYQVSLRFQGMHVCGGALISPSHVLTAAHCVADLFDEPYDDLTVLTGTDNLKSGGHVNGVKAVKWHPKFIPQPETFWNHDIAVITLEKPIKPDSKQKSVKLPIKDITENDRTGLVTGFGRPVTLNPYPSTSLLSMKTTVLTSKVCEPLTFQKKVLDTQICGLQKAGVGVCKGDSGGPLIVDGRLVGLVSWNRPEPCGSGIPDVYTNVYRYLEYIKSVTIG